MVMDAENGGLGNDREEWLEGVSNKDFQASRGGALLGAEALGVLRAGAERDRACSISRIV